MANYFKDNPDLLYYFEKGVDWEPLVEATELGTRAEDGFGSAAEAVEFYREISEMIGEFVAEEVAPHAAAIDRTGVELKDGEVVMPVEMEQIFAKIKELDLHGMTLPRELGGLNAPLLLNFVSTELFARAEVSVMAHHGFHGGIAMAMLMFSILEGTSEIDIERFKVLDTRFRSYIEEILRGEAWGCMDITEPDAGSDMAALRTRAEQDEKGDWYVTGQKIFITSGHGKYHFVIARTEEAAGDGPLAGLGALSMFLVPTYETDAEGNVRRLAAVERVEEKMGHHGSATCAISFDRSPAHLIGKRGEGFKYMLMLMNNARLGVGFETLGLCEAAYRLARDYAAERPSMGKTIDRHEMIADYLDEMRTDIQGLRALAVSGAVAEELSRKWSLQRRNQKAAARLKARARRLTPLLKYLGAEKAVEMARRAVQIHGGNGYMKEFGAEKLLRDAVVMPIYEGTSQIQALMAMKDTLGRILKNPQEFVMRRAQTRWRALRSRDPLERRVARLQQLSQAAQQHLIARTATDKVRSLTSKPITAWPRELTKNWNPKRDFAWAMLHAERLILLLADEAICEVLLEQAREHEERRELLERYLERAEPRSRYLYQTITSTGQRLLSDLAARTGGEDERAAG